MTDVDRAMLRASIRVQTINPVYRHGGIGIATYTHSGRLQRAYSNRWGMEMAVRASASLPPVIEWEGEYGN